MLLKEKNGGNLVQRMHNSIVQRILLEESYSVKNIKFKM